MPSKCTCSSVLGRPSRNDWKKINNKQKRKEKEKERRKKKKEKERKGEKKKKKKKEEKERRKNCAWFEGALQVHVQLCFGKA